MSGLWSSMRGWFGKGDGARKHTPAEVFRSLRATLLATDPAALGLAATPSNQVWGMLIETAYPTAVVSLIVIGDGTVSLYVSTGGGIIGAGAHEGPRAAGEALLLYAPTFLDQAAAATRDVPLPRKDCVRFTFLTFGGISSVEDDQKAIENTEHPLSPLFRKSHDVITHLRLLDELQRGSGGRGAHSVGVDAKQLLAVAAAGKRDSLAAMIKAGAAPDTADENGLTPLMAAAHGGQAKIVEMLVSSCAIDARDRAGYTALMFACNAGHALCAQILLHHGAKVNALDDDGSTPLMFAAQHGHNEVVRLLMNRGADPGIVGKHGLSALGFARQNSHRETERLLKQ